MNSRELVIVASPNKVYLLEKIFDDPRYEGFAGGPFLECFPRNRRTRNWKVIRQAPSWKPQEVRGRVRKFNDFPCWQLLPAFSATAVDALRDFLEPNGELLPLKSSAGSYFAYNTTTVADVLNVKRSKIQWIIEPYTALIVERYELYASKLKGLSIFRIPQKPSHAYVTEVFAERAREHGLRGMEFQLVWPVPKKIFWGTLAKQERKNREARELPKGQTVKGNTVVIRLMFAKRKSSGSAAEKRRIEKIMDQLDALLVDQKSTAPVVGSLEGSDYGVRGECRLFLSCPEARRLIQRLRPWLKSLQWPNPLLVLKRYGNYTDREAREEPVKGIA